MIMVVAVQHFDLWSLRLAGGLRKGPISSRYHVALDLTVVVVVAVLSIAINVVLAVFIGVAIAIALFVHRMSSIRNPAQLSLRRHPFAQGAHGTRSDCP